MDGRTSVSECLISSAEKQTKAMHKLPLLATKFRTVTMATYAKTSFLLHGFSWEERKKCLSILEKALLAS